MDGALVGREYAEHLTDTDLKLLASAAGAPAPGAPAPGGPPGAVPVLPADADAGWLRRDPAAIPGLLGDPRVFEAVFGWPVSGGPVVGGGDQGRAPRPGQAVPVSPFLTFAVAVHRSAIELASMGHVAERTGPRQRIPLFDAPALRDFLGSPARKLFLAELLASFTRVASGRYRVGGGGRTRTRRFSELDPVRLAGLLDGVPDAERPGVYRRLGDVSLFVAGVFPDYATLYGVGPASVARLLRAAQVPAAEQERSNCSSSWAPGGTGPPTTWPRYAPPGWTWWPTWRAGSSRPAGSSTTSPTGTCSPPTIRGSRRQLPESRAS